MLLALATLHLSAQDVKGDWEGTLSYQGVELPILFHVSGQDGAYESTMDSPDQDAIGIEMDQTTFADGTLTIKFSAADMSYTAKLDEKGENLKGTFVQQGVSIPLEMSRTGEKNGP